jgi:hypothetical protein
MAGGRIAVANSPAAVLPMRWSGSVGGQNLSRAQAARAQRCQGFGLHVDRVVRAAGDFAPVPTAVACWAPGAYASSCRATGGRHRARVGYVRSSFMRVPILVVLPSQEPLQESAMAFQQQRAPTIPITAANVPRPVELDPAFAAVPVGTGRPQDGFTEALEPTVSPAFAVRDSLKLIARRKFPTTTTVDQSSPNRRFKPSLRAVARPQWGTLR